MAESVDTEAKKNKALQAILAYLLENGLEHTGIRAMAKAAGISDRMLIYYFESKDKLIAEALELLSLQLTGGIEMLIGDDAKTAADFLAAVETAMSMPQFENATKLFMEVIARAGRGIEPYASTAKEVIQNWEDQIGNYLVPEEEMTPHEVLVQFEGRTVLRLIKHG